MLQTEPRLHCVSCRRKAGRLPYMFIVLCLFFCTGLSAAQERKIPLPPPQKPVDYRSPTREYVISHLGDWTVYVESQLQTDAPAIAKQALTRLENKLDLAMKALPETCHARLKKLPIFLMYGPKAKGGGRDNGLEYFQKNAPEHDKQIDPRWASGIVIYCGENYGRISEFWALKAVLHEFAHAYQLEQWPEDQPDIFKAWDNATRHGLYHNVKDDSGKTVEKAYASVNPLEYFAELSCIYFVGCNYQPFNRKELKAYDPVGYALIQKMWYVNSSEQTKP